MLDPVRLLKVPDELVQLFYDLETDILKDIAERLVLNDFKLSPTSAYKLKKLDELGLHQDAVIKRIASILKESEKKVKKAVTDTSYQNIRTDNEQLKQYDLFSNASYDTGELRDIMMRGIRQTNGELKNITKSMAAAASKTYERALDNAYLKVRSGAYSYTEAINTAVEDLAKKGMETFTYKSGRHEQVATVVRRAVLTGVNKTAIETQLKNLSNMGMDLVRTTQHLGARPTHEVWQGKTFYYGEPVEGYQSLEEGTGYGTGDGLGGWNCRHGIRIALEEMGISYTEEPVDTKENNRIYELEQQQRYNERMIREWKRRRDIKKAGGLDYAKESRKVKEWNARQESFIKAHPELKRQINRESFGKNIVSRGSKYDRIKATGNDDEDKLMGEYSKVGVLNLKLLKDEFGPIRTDEVILMKERELHIIERHPNDYECFMNNRFECITDPDIIIKDTKHLGTLFIIKKLDDTNLNVLLRIVMESDNPNFKNSIMTAYQLNDKKVIKLIDKHKLLYKKE